MTVSGLTIAKASVIRSAIRYSPAKNRRSNALSAGRLVDFLRKTLSCWRSGTISASREALDRNTSRIAPKISLKTSAMKRSMPQLSVAFQSDQICGRHSLEGPLCKVETDDANHFH